MRKIRINLEVFGTIAPNLSDFYKHGPPPKVIIEIEANVLNFIKNNKNILFDKVKEFLFKE